jgi:hypothetical protein
LVLSPDLIKTAPVHSDVKKRAEYYIENIQGNIGAYCPKKGYQFVQ